MAITGLLLTCVLFGLVWQTFGLLNRSRRRRRRLAARRRRRLAFYFSQEQEWNAVATILVSDIFASTLQRRYVWARTRSQVFANSIATWDDSEWKRNFRVSRETFQYLCTVLQPHVRHTSAIREVISVEKRVAITLWRLGTNIEYRTISHLFGVGLSSACIIVHEVCKAIVDVLLAKYIKIPSGNQALEVVKGFEDRWDFPQCFGSIDGSHIPILPPANDARDYYNRKGFHSVVIQALVDHQHRFMNVNVGWPGSVHDARILSNSEVFEKGESGTLTPNFIRTFGGVPVPVVIIGDPAYPLLPWLIKPYPGVGLGAKKTKFNNRLSRARVVVECAFGRLKGRWRSLLKRNDVRVDHITNLVTACCILHNLCEIHQDSFDEQWLDEEVQASAHPMSTSAAIIPSSSTGTVIRDALCDYIDNN